MQAVMLLRLMATLCICLLGAPTDRSLAQGDRSVLVIDIKGAIGFVAAGQLGKAVEQAAAQESPAVIVRLDTPGGLLTSTRDMIHTILASPVAIVMYVAPNGSRAASAGTYLMYASHVAAMAPGTHLGAATTISLSPPGFPGSPPSKPSPDSLTRNPTPTRPPSPTARASMMPSPTFARSQS
jgi:membrane-bound serine protease (ClpP class)